MDFGTSSTNICVSAQPSPSQQAQDLQRSSSSLPTASPLHMEPTAFSLAALSLAQSNAATAGNKALPPGCEEGFPVSFELEMDAVSAGIPEEARQLGNWEGRPVWGGILSSPAAMQMRAKASVNWVASRRSYHIYLNN